MLKHTIVALLCWILPALAFGASFQSAQPTNLESPIGVQVNRSDHKIVGGANAPDGEFPYQVSLRSPSNSHFCGGSIISPAWILTAAHCVPNLSPSSVMIVAGTNMLNSGGIAYGVAQIVSHASYNPQNNANDIALLRVNGQIAYTDNVKSIQLGSLSPLPGETLVLSGWGLTSYPGQQLPNQLQYIGLLSIGILNCQQQLPGYPISTVGNICSSAPVGQGACQGDSGGPLVTQAGVQVGIVSWGIPCAKGKPDIFTSVAAYRLWILVQTGVLL